MKTTAGGSGESGHLRARHIAAYADGRASGARLRRIEAHLSDCSLCCEELLEIRRIRPQATRRPGVRWLGAGGAVAAAAAALIVIAQPWAGSPDGLDPGSGVQRSTGEEASALRVTAPGDAEEVVAGALALSWRAANEMVSDQQALYSVVLMSERGDSVWALSTRDTTVTVPGDLLEAGESYVWYVDALLPDGTPASSGVRHFRVRP